uniref:Exportin-4 n=1 Tax=Albugo laibachii Nc14 TaxID=890382 RepID=F0W0D7_9STRA|nr:exportin4 putative [Albugo laibachii Nc14]|eukprot:CCA14509.1 exportin4 putative [Albugo laibachii Nc14]
MDTFEQACLILYAANPSDQLRQAEAYLNAFANASTVLQDAFHVLTLTTHTTVQFHCIKVFREELLRKWIHYSPSERAEWFRLLNEFLLSKFTQLSTFISNALLQTIVVFQKRSWLEFTPTERSQQIQGRIELLEQNGVGCKVATDTHNKQLLAVKWIHTLIQEFGSPSRAQVTYQPVQTHIKARKIFEDDGLEIIAQNCFFFLSNLLRNVDEIKRHIDLSRSDLALQESLQAQLNVLEGSYTMCIELLTWKMSSSGSVRNEHQNLAWSLTNLKEDDQGDFFLEPCHFWREWLIQSELVYVACKSYATLREIAVFTRRNTLAHLGRQLLIQMGSLRGPIFINEEMQVNYLKEVFLGTQSVVKNPLLNLITIDDIDGKDIATKELIDMCQIISRVVKNLGSKLLQIESCATLGKNLIEEIANLCLNLLQASSHDITHHSQAALPRGDMWALEAVEILLDAWAALSIDTDLEGLTKTQSDGKIPPCINHNEILKHRLDSVIGMYVRVQTELCAREALTENDQEEEIDDETDKSQENLEVIAKLARVDVMNVSKILLGMFGELNAEMHSLISLGNNSLMTSELVSVFEKLHFLVRFTGLYLSDDYQNEHPSLPTQIDIACQMNQNGSFVELIILVTKEMLNYECKRLDHNPSSQTISPYLLEQLYKTTSRLCATYVTTSEKNGKTDILRLQKSVLKVFIVSPGSYAENLVRFFFECVIVCLENWPTQTLVIDYAIDLLMVLSRTGALSCVIETPLWQSIAQANAEAVTYLHSTQNSATSSIVKAMSRIPTALRGRLMEAVCRATYSPPISEIQTVQFTRCLIALKLRLQNLSQYIYSDKEHARNDVLAEEESILLLQLYTGCVLASRTQKLVIQHCIEALPDFVRFTEVNANTQLVYYCLAFVRDFVGVHLSYLSPKDAVHVYKQCQLLIHSYTYIHQSKSSWADMEEDACRDLIALFQLLNHLITNECVNFADEEESTEHQNKESTQVLTEVVFDGLKCIISMMTEQLMQYPALLQQFFATIGYIIESYPAQLMRLSSASFTELTDFILLGVQHMSTDISRTCLQALGSMVTYYYKAMAHGQPLGPAEHVEQCSAFFMRATRLILDISLMQQFDPAILDPCAIAVYNLILIQQVKAAEFSLVAQSVCEKHRDDQVKQQLMRCLGQLAESVGEHSTDLLTVRKNRSRFKISYHSFVADARGYLQFRAPQLNRPKLGRIINNRNNRECSECTTNISCGQNQLSHIANAASHLSKIYSP